MSDDIPVHLREFIAARIGSIAHLELLLLMRGEPNRAWTIDEAAKALYTSTQACASLMEALRNMGALSVEGSDEPRYKYAPQSEQLRTTVDELADLYATRRVTVINLIYSGPEDKLRSFANAFRFRPGGGK